jgi:hypothetical protein
MYHNINEIRLAHKLDAEPPIICRNADHYSSLRIPRIRVLPWSSSIRKLFHLP